MRQGERTLVLLGVDDVFAGDNLKEDLAAFHGARRHRLIAILVVINEYLNDLKLESERRRINDAVAWNSPRY